MAREFIKVEPGTEVFIVIGPGRYERTDAKISSVEKATIHKQHKTGKLVVEPGKDADKYTPEMRSVWSIQCAEWSAVKTGSSWGRGQTLIPVTDETAEWVKSQIKIIKAERLARAQSERIEELLKSLRGDAMAAADIQAAADVLEAAKIRVTAERVKAQEGE